MKARALIAVLWVAACGSVVEYDDAAPEGPIYGTTRPGNSNSASAQDAGNPTPRPGTESDGGTTGTEDGGTGSVCSQVDGGFCFNGGQCCGSACCAVDESCCSGTCIRFGVNTPFCPSPI